MSSKDQSCVINFEIDALLKALGTSEGFKEFELNITSGSAKGDGYLSHVKNVRISGLKNENENAFLDVIIKCSETNSATRSQIPVNDLYKQEIHMYSVIFPLYRSLESEKGLRKFNVAKFYNSYVNEKEEFLMLENIKENGYKLHERKVPMDEDHVKLILTQYAHLHALSFVLRDQKREVFQKAVENMADIQDIMLRRIFRKTFVDECRRSINVLNPLTDQDAIVAYQSILDNLETVFNDVVENPKDEYCAITHGDCWSNNMMFKYDDPKNPTKPTDACLLDFQVSDVGPPVKDISYFFFACGSNSVINNYDYYLEFYYKTLSAYISQLGSDPDRLYPHSIFIQQWKKCAKYAIFVTPLALRIMLSETTEVIDFDQVVNSGKNICDAFDYKLQNDDKYNKRLRHIILCLFKNNLL